MNALRRVPLVLAAVLLLGLERAEAQSLQRLSLQASGAVLFATTSDPAFDSERRLGFEGQLRYTFSRFSLGAGYQRSTVFSAPGLKIALSLGFVEPRFVLAASHGLAFYLAGRTGLGKLLCSPSASCNARKTNFTAGGGGGFLFRLSSRLSADLGGQYFHVSGDLPSNYAMVRLGLGLGF